MGYGSTGVNMGYCELSKRLYCARIFLNEAEKEYLSFKNDEISVSFKLSRFHIIKANIIRAIRMVYLLIPDDNTSSLDELTRELRGNMDSKYYESLIKLYFQDFRVHFHSIIYGESYFQDKDGKEVLEKDAEKKPNLPSQALFERLRNLDKLFELTMKIMFEIYLEDKEEDLYYYHFTELYDISQMYDILISDGYANSIEEAKEKYGDDADEIYEKFQELFDKVFIEDTRDMFFSEIWASSEIGFISS